jgi:hypothetical protein
MPVAEDKDKDKPPLKRTPPVQRQGRVQVPDATAAAERTEITTAPAPVRGSVSLAALISVRFRTYPACIILCYPFSSRYPFSFFSSIFPLARPPNRANHRDVYIYVHSVSPSEAAGIVCLGVGFRSRRLRRCVLLNYLFIILILHVQRSRRLSQEQLHVVPVDIPAKAKAKPSEGPAKIAQVRCFK